MIRSLFLACASMSAALVPVTAVTAQEQSGGFSLPQASPTPTPAPQGPADERAGVAIPPRSAPPPPRIAPAPVLTPEPEVLVPPRAQPATPQPVRTPSPTPARSPAPPLATSPATNPAPGEAATPLAEPPPSDDPLAFPDAQPLPTPDAPAVAIPEAEAATDPVLAALPPWWPWAAGGIGGLAALGIGALAWRRRRRKPLRLASPPPELAQAALPPDPVRPADLALDLVLDITGATRSVMMFTLHYRLTIANRAGHAVGDVNLAVLLACARSGAGNAAAPGAAQQLDRLDRIGPFQNIALTGSVQLPLSAIAPLRQGRTPLFIPLVHVTLEAEGQSALTRSFVVGTPSAAGTGRLHPIQLDIPPGSITGLMAQRIAVPEISAAA